MPLKGMKDDDLYTYYNEASALEKLKDGMSVSIPFLCVTAKNDPFIPPPVRPTKEVAQSNENIFVVNTKLGGHIGKCIKLIGSPNIIKQFNFFNDFCSKRLLDARGRMLGYQRCNVILQ